MTKWKITIPNFIGGFAPAWYLDTYPVYGNKNMAGDMQNIDLINPTKMTQGPGLVDLTRGNESGSISTLVRGILDKAQAADVSFGVGGSQFYKLGPTAVVTAASPPYPHTISGSNVVAEDIEYYKGDIYYSHYDDTAGDVGKHNLTAFDDDWATVSAAANISASVPLPLEVGGNDFMYLGMKNRLSSYDGTTWLDTDLDLPTNCEIQDVKWSSNRLWIAANQPDLAGSNKVIGSIFVWDGDAASWEDEIKIMGRIGALYVKNGVVYVFYQDVTSTGGYKLGFISGTQIRELCSFKGALPAYYQISEYKNFIIWVSSDKIWAYGAADKSIPGMVFQLADGGHSTVGGLATPFGTPMVASYDGSSAYRLAKFSGYDTNCNWKSLMFPVGPSTVKQLIIYHDKLGTGARADFDIVGDRGNVSAKAGTLSATTIYRKPFNVGLEIDNDFRVEFDTVSGSSANAVSINRMEILGVSREI